MVTTPLTLALDELAGVVGSAAHDPATTASLAAAVSDLEHVAGASLGRTDGEPQVVLARRFARAHRLLLSGAAQELDVTRVRRHVLRLLEAASPAVAATRRGSLVTAGRS